METTTIETPVASQLASLNAWKFLPREILREIVAYFSHDKSDNTNMKNGKRTRASAIHYL